MLVKIPFLASQALWFYISVTSPNNAPPPKERTGHRYWLEVNVANAILSARGLDLAKVSGLGYTFQTRQVIDNTKRSSSGR